jgi:alkanesulfonate monooxygenase SsuD/methylene tetrahydromethanopterin reductase-like flavin-dependent oxidoreductase (luciferase family)
VQVFLFDLMHYKADISRFEVDGVLPRRLGRSAFDAKAAVETYAEHLDAWEEMEKVGFDGIGVNEHHATPFGLMNSPNLLAAAAAQRTERMKILIYGNLLPLHEPMRLAEELAMLDCLTNGRLIAGVARGAQREYRAHNIAMEESRARFDECFEIMRRAWTEDVFSFQGRFHSYEDVSIWPRPVQQPHPPVWVPVTGSKDSIEWAADRDIPITPGVTPAGTAREDILRHYAECQARHGRKVTPAHLNIMVDCYVADSKAQAIKEYGPHFMYAFNTLIKYDHPLQDFDRKGYYSSTAHAHMRAGAKGTLADTSMFSNRITEESLKAQAEHMAWGTADEVVEKITAEADQAGAGTVLLMCNRGAMPKDQFINQIRRLGSEVVPRLKAHKITCVPYAEGVEAGA